MEVNQLLRWQESNWQAQKTHTRTKGENKLAQ